MNNLNNRQGDAVDRTIKFGADHPIVPPLASVTALLAELGTLRTDLLSFAGEQDTGDGAFRGGTANRRLLADELRELMRPINKIARSVSPRVYPGLREKFRMPPGGSYPKLIARAEAFASAIADHKAVFLDRGMAATFDVELAAKKEALIASTGQQNSGQAQRMEGTGNLEAKSREAMAALKELDAILSHHYRNDPGLLAAWKGACRVERDAVRAGNPPPAVAGGSNSPASA